MSDKEFEEPVVESDLTDVDESVVEPKLEAVEVEEVAEPEPVVGAVVPPAPKKQEKLISVPMAVDIEKVYEALPEPAGPAVVGLGEVDDVSLSACVLKNEKARKSLSVYHLQRRLIELGYGEASFDKSGYMGDLTMAAALRFQADNKKLDQTGVLDEATFKAIFKGDPNVRVIV